MSTTIFEPNPISFLYAHQDEDAVITANFPNGTNYHHFRLRASIRMELFLQDHRDVIVDARYSAARRRENTDNKYEARFEKTTQVDGVEPEDAVMIHDLPADLMFLNQVIVDLSDDSGKAYIKMASASHYSWMIQIITEDPKTLRSLCRKITGEKYYIDDGTDQATSKTPKLGLLQTSQHGFHIQNVDLNQNRHMNSAELDLHFGSKIIQLQEHVIKSLNQDPSGLHLFQGVAGSGKTSFLNHLTAELAETHRLIYLPISAFQFICSPEAIGLWVQLADESKTGKKNVLIIEDAEALIQSREEVGAAQGSVVSTLLNLSDGLLGNVLNLHVIATINTESKNIDHALLRAGRLRTYNEFKALDFDQSKRLADHLGRSLPDQNKTYTLAEIYNGEAQKTNEEPSLMGFQVSA
jgi:hypothetical protein